ncbi:hypothetical protein [Geomonas edaphica]|uniref:hypothetical protein n=1 Tax=Geomonas edaphica TaxID=2570226 RepID=UPI0010A8C681|nr:hypothetical protein [Geomonas edaphica]
MQYTEEIIWGLFENVRSRLTYLAVHGSYLQKHNFEAKDIDLIAIFDVIDPCIINEMQNIHMRHPFIHILPYGDAEIKVYPPYNTMQFFMMAKVIYGSLPISAPDINDLIYYLKSRLSDNVIIKVRNAYLRRGRSNVYSLKMLWPVVQKEINWWWRNYIYITSGEILYDKTELVSKINFPVIRDLLLVENIFVDQCQEQIMYQLEQGIEVMVKCLNEVVYRQQNDEL